LEEAIEAVEAATQAERERIDARFAGRIEWISRAYAASRRQLSAAVEELKTRTITELQMQGLDAKSGGKEAVAAAEAEGQRLLGEAAEVKGELAVMVRRAQGATRGYLGFGRMLSVQAGAKMEIPEDAGGAEELLGQAREGVKAAERSLKEFEAFAMPRLLKFTPWWLLLALLVVGGGLWISFGVLQVGGDWRTSAGAFLVLAGVLLAVYFIGGRSAKAAARQMAEEVERTRRLLVASRSAAREEFETEKQRIKEKVADTATTPEDRRRMADDLAERRKKKGERKIEEQIARVTSMNETAYRRSLEPLEPKCEAEVAALREDSAARLAELERVRQEEQSKVDASHAASREELIADWKRVVDPIYAEAAVMEGAAAPLTRAWERGFLESWKPGERFVEAAPFARLEVDAEGLAVSKGLTLEGARKIVTPLSLCFPDVGALLFETGGAGRDEAVEVLNNIILRLLTATPPGKLNFTIIDPVGLGENFAGVMHLADYEDSLINGRIWTQRGQIEEKLAEVNEHIEKVIQMYLRNEYDTITEYNEQAGNIAEKYHFVVIADFPSGFGETAAKRLESIVLTGARCGVYTLIHWDKRHAEPQDFVADTLRENSVCLEHDGERYTLVGAPEVATRMIFDTPAPPDVAIDFIHKVGRSSTDSNRVEVPFAHIMPEDGALWTNETTNELRIPIGRTGATKLQYLAIGKGTRQHALFAGKTGSGKSTLFHVIITNLALSCSPDAVEFYLVDFKKGVEFKCYATKHLPHARVVAIESDREFGLSVLQRVDEELRRRGDMFRKLGVQDIPGYKRAGGSEPVPRCLLMIDEFQELFVEDDRISQGASVLLDRIVRQGRAFGIHVLLGSQTLGGAFTLARTTLGQMVIRVALQCNEADAYLIMDDDNPAPRLLTRPGEGIYNDSAGAIEANSPFQVVWLPDEERDVRLDTVNGLARERGFTDRVPIVFEGNAPAEVRENAELAALLAAPELVPARGAAKAWFGAPNSIKGPTEGVFARQSGSNLLVVGQREEAALAIGAVSLVSLAAQFPKGGAKFVVCDGTLPGSPEGVFLESVMAAIPHEVEVVKNHDIPEVMGRLDAELKIRSADEVAAAEAPTTFLILLGLAKFKKLKQEDDFDFSFSGEESGPAPGAQFADLVAEGPGHGMHVIAAVDTYNNVNRFLSRKVLSEFEMRIVFQMSANDSASLVDSTDASTLGLHRALFYNEHDGYIETFRPYALPGKDWVEEVAADLERLAGAGEAGRAGL